MADKLSKPEWNMTQFFRVSCIYAIIAVTGIYTLEFAASYLVLHPDEVYVVLSFFATLCLVIGVLVATRNKWLNKKFEENITPPEQILSTREIQVFQELANSEVK